MKNKNKAGDEKKVWFKASYCNWGWCPCTWQGWTAVIAYMVVLIWSLRVIDSNFRTGNALFLVDLPFIFAITAAIVILSLIKGERKK